jgi:predicted nucleic acid-binding protein
MKPLKLAYVDTSCVVAVTFDEPGADQMRALLAGFDRLLSSNLLEAEWRAALRRERVSAIPDDVLESLTWVLPNRSLSAEIQRVLATGYLRGADTWHLACALFLDPSASELSVVTLDEPQRAAARELGFPTPAADTKRPPSKRQGRLKR